MTRRTMVQSAAALPLAAAGTAAPLLPTVRLGKFEITRLIIGSNPFNGYAYSLPSLEQHMKEWFTAGNVAATLRRPRKRHQHPPVQLSSRGHGEVRAIPDGGRQTAMVAAGRRGDERRPDADCSYRKAGCPWGSSTTAG